MIGAKIKNIRHMNKTELSNEGWDDEDVIAIELNNKTVLYASRDYEGNGGGAIFGYEKDTNKSFALSAERFPEEEEDSDES